MSAMSTWPDAAPLTKPDGRPAIDAQRIAAAALEIVDQRGMAGFTMRAVAERLGVAPMSLYHYVGSKSELISIMVERSVGEAPLPPPSGNGWREDIWAIADWMRQGMRRNPNRGELHAQNEGYTPSMITFAERWVDTWLQSGLGFEEATRAAMITLAGVTGGLAALEPRTQHSTLPSSPTWTPGVRAMLESVTHEENFEVFVRSLVEGLYVHLASERCGPTRARSSGATSPAGAGSPEDPSTR